MIWNWLMLKRKRVQYGRRLVIHGHIFIHGGKHCVVIGDNCKIISSENSNPTSGIGHTHLVAAPGAKLIIGNNVGISQANITAYNSVTIEDNVLIGSGVKIWDTDFHEIDYDDRMNKKGNVKSAPVVIKEGAFIGACSIILKGVTIGKHSVIGAGSIVTRSIPDGEIWAGNPARKINIV